MTHRPTGPNYGEVTALLRGWSDGEADASERALPLVYDELHRMAARYLAGERAGVSLQPTALVNEVFVRLLGWDQVRWQNRAHFFGVSARMMRRVLVDIARRRLAERRGGAGAIRVPLGRRISDSGSHSTSDRRSLKPQLRSCYSKRIVPRRRRRSPRRFSRFTAASMPMTRRR